MNILVNNQNILATDVTETTTEIVATDAIYPKHVLGTYQIIETALPDDYAPGKYLWDNGFALIPLTPAPMTVPESVTMRQARLALNAAGLLDQVTQAVAASGAEAQIEWEYATEVKRDWPLVVQLGELLSLDLDALFIEASKL